MAKTGVLLLLATLLAALSGFLVRLLALLAALSGLLVLLAALILIILVHSYLQFFGEVLLECCHSNNSPYLSLNAANASDLEKENLTIAVEKIPFAKRLLCHGFWKI
ncbi:MAG: hypothetical protein WAK55_02960 [Xanthobacteraceae bacterium]